MSIKILTSFFMWCSVMNGLMLSLWTIVCAFIPNLVYRTQNAFFPMKRETFNVAIYYFLGTFKMVFIAFNLIPYLALVIIGKNQK